MRNESSAVRIGTRSLAGNWPRDIDERPETTLYDELNRRGLKFPGPDELTDEDLPCALWRLLRRLAELHVFLYSTNHLSDRDLYERLWYRELPMETVMPCLDEDEALHLDLIMPGSEDEVVAYLKYYADDEDRARWKEDYPGMPMPERAAFPFDRDRFMPQREDLHARLAAGRAAPVAAPAL